MKTKVIRDAMKANNITYAEMGAELDRSHDTVRQRLNTESTFHIHYPVYRDALIKCLNKRKEDIEKTLEEL